MDTAVADRFEVLDDEPASRFEVLPEEAPITPPPSIGPVLAPSSGRGAPKPNRGYTNPGGLLEEIALQKQNAAMKPAAEEAPDYFGSLAREDFARFSAVEGFNDLTPEQKQIALTSAGKMRFSGLDYAHIVRSLKAGGDNYRLGDDFRYWVTPSEIDAYAHLHQVDLRQGLLGSLAAGVGRSAERVAREMANAGNEVANVAQPWGGPTLGTGESLPNLPSRFPGNPIEHPTAGVAGEFVGGAGMMALEAMAGHVVGPLAFAAQGFGGAVEQGNAQGWTPGQEAAIGAERALVNVAMGRLIPKYVPGESSINSAIKTGASIYGLGVGQAGLEDMMKQELGLPAEDAFKAMGEAALSGEGAATAALMGAAHGVLVKMGKTKELQWRKTIDLLNGLTEKFKIPMEKREAFIRFVAQTVLPKGEKEGWNADTHKNVIIGAVKDFGGNVEAPNGETPPTHTKAEKAPGTPETAITREEAKTGPTGVPSAQTQQPAPEAAAPGGEYDAAEAAARMDEEEAKLEEQQPSAKTEDVPGFDRFEIIYPLTRGESATGGADEVFPQKETPDASDQQGTVPLAENEGGGGGVGQGGGRGVVGSDQGPGKAPGAGTPPAPTPAPNKAGGGPAPENKAELDEGVKKHPVEKLSETLAADRPAPVSKPDAFKQLVSKLPRHQMQQLAREAGNMDLTDDNKLVFRDTRSSTGNWAMSKREFVDWLMGNKKGDDPLTYSQDKEWTDLIQKARGIAQNRPDAVASMNVGPGGLYEEFIVRDELAAKKVEKPKPEKVEKKLTKSDQGKMDKALAKVKQEEEAVSAAVGPWNKIQAEKGLREAVMEREKLRRQLGLGPTTPREGGGRRRLKDLQTNVWFILDGWLWKKGASSGEQYMVHALNMDTGQAETMRETTQMVQDYKSRVEPLPEKPKASKPADPKDAWAAWAWTLQEDPGPKPDFASMSKTRLQSIARKLHLVFAGDKPTQERMAKAIGEMFDGRQRRYLELKKEFAAATEGAITNKEKLVGADVEFSDPIISVDGKPQTYWPSGLGGKIEAIDDKGNVDVRIKELRYGPKNADLHHDSGKLVKAHMSTLRPASGGDWMDLLEQVNSGGANEDVLLSRRPQPDREIGEIQSDLNAAIEERNRLKETPPSGSERVNAIAKAQRKVEKLAAELRTVEANQSEIGRTPMRQLLEMKDSLRDEIDHLSVGIPDEQSVRDLAERIKLQYKHVPGDAYISRTSDGSLHALGEWSPEDLSTYLAYQEARAQLGGSDRETNLKISNLRHDLETVKDEIRRRMPKQLRDLELARKKSIIPEEQGAPHGEPGSVEAGPEERNLLGSYLGEKSRTSVGELQASESKARAHVTTSLAAFQSGCVPHYSDPGTPEQHAVASMIESLVMGVRTHFMDIEMTLGDTNVIDGAVSRKYPRNVFLNAQLEGRTLVAKALHEVVHVTDLTSDPWFETAIAALDNPLQTAQDFIDTPGLENYGIYAPEKQAGEALAHTVELFVEGKQPPWIKDSEMERLVPLMMELINRGNRRLASRNLRRYAADEPSLAGTASEQAGRFGSEDLAASRYIVSSLRAKGAVVSDAGDLHGDTSVSLTIRRLDEWIEQFMKDPLVKANFSSKDLKSLAEAMRYNKMLLGDLHLVPEEVPDVSTLRYNSDPEFGDTWDLSTICKRQDQYVASINALQHQMGRIFNRAERFAIGEMLDVALGSVEGEGRSCWYCYGQASRDVAAEGIIKIGKIWRYMEAIRGVETEEDIKAAFGWERGPLKGWRVKGWDTDGLLRKAIAEYRDVPEAQAIMKDEPKLHDVIMGYAEAKPGPEKAFTDIFREVIQGALKPNMPKGYAPSWREFMKLSPKAVERKNRSAGQRLNSQTEFRLWHFIDLAQGLAQMKAVKLMAHAYTSSYEFVKFAGAAGIKFNLSVEYATGEDGHIMRDQETGKAMFNGMHRMSYEHSMELCREFPRDVGTMLVPINLEQVLDGLGNDDIHMMIPFHAGNIDREITSFQEATDFTSMNKEKWGAAAGQGVRALQLKSGREILVDTGSFTKAPEVLTRYHHNNDMGDYLDLCQQMGIRPRFYPFVSAEAFAQYCQKRGLEMPRVDPKIFKKGYMKLIRDVAREPSNQRIVDPRKLDWEFAHAQTDKWMQEGGDKLEADPNVVRYLAQRIEDGDWPKNRLGQEIGADYGTPAHAEDVKFWHEESKAEEQRREAEADPEVASAWAKVRESGKRALHDLKNLFARSELMAGFIPQKLAESVTQFAVDVVKALAKTGQHGFENFVRWVAHNADPIVRDEIMGRATKYYNAAREHADIKAAKYDATMTPADKLPPVGLKGYKMVKDIAKLPPEPTAAPTKKETREAEGALRAVSPDENLRLLIAVREKAEAAIAKLKSVAAVGQAVRDQIAGYAKELPAELRADFIGRIAKAQTPGDLRAALASMDKHMESYMHDAALNRVRRLIDGADPAHMDPHFKRAYEQLLGNVDLKNPTARTLRLAEGLSDHLDSLDQQARDHLLATLPARALKLLARLGKERLKDMSTEELQDLGNAIQSIIHQNAVKKMLLAGKKMREVTEAVEAMAAEIGSLHGQLGKTEARDDVAAEAKDEGAIARLNHYLSSPEISLIIAGGEGSETHAQFYETLRVAGNRTRILWRQHFNEVRRVLAKHGYRDAVLWGDKSKTLVDWYRRPRTVRLGGKNVDLTGPELVSLHLYSLNTDARAKVLNNGILPERFKGRASEIVHISDADLETGSRALTPFERDLADAFLRINTELGAEITRQYVKLFGYEPLMEKGYFPEVPDTSFREGMIEDLASEAPPMTARWLENGGPLKPRVKHSLPMLLTNAMTTQVKSMRFGTAFAGKAVAARDARLLLNSVDLRAVLGEHVGKKYAAQLARMVRDWSGAQINPLGFYEKAARWMARNLAASKLGFRPTSIAMNFFGGPLGFMTQMTQKEAAVFSSQWAKHAGNVLRARSYFRENIEPYNVYLAERYDPGAEMHRLAVSSEGSEMGGTGLPTAKTQLGQKFRDLQDFSMAGMQAAEMRAVVVLHRALKLAHPEWTPEQIGERMERDVRRTQNSVDELDTSEALRDARRNPVLGLGLMFTNQATKMRDLLELELVRAKRAGTPAAYARLAVVAALVGISAAVLTELVRGFWSRIKHGFQGKEKEAPQVALDALASAAEVVHPWVGDAIRVVRGNLQTNLAGGAPELVARAANEIYNALNAKRSKVKTPERVYRVASNLARALSMVLGAPVDIPLEVLEGVWKAAHAKRDSWSSTTQPAR
jgi:hypothetical protein